MEASGSANGCALQLEDLGVEGGISKEGLRQLLAVQVDHGHNLGLVAAEDAASVSSCREEQEEEDDEPGRMDYDIRDTFKDSRRTVKNFLDVHQKMILALSYGLEYGSYAVFIDNNACDKELLRTDEQWGIMLGGHYYMHHAMNPDLQSIRNGIVMVHECEGYTMGKSGGLATAKRLSMEFSAHYPTLHRVVKFYNAGMFMNITLSTFKRFLPKQFRDKFEIGMGLPNRLDTYFLVPTPEEAQHRTYLRLVENLKVRYENEATFSL
ncbi:expressed unknown protein [Seminavis robusta]|uniref:CRAL-TRIO domain-containing protein n=1 Tax=Seminavis robusta TaxID=568900 RepID=A0A9N8DFV6_9STRA|nr:expressed unknown protein [Seminavis robusta]|eukprot:Sro105_g053090.1 n/a (266) ;mRNA; r:15424-16481